MGHAGRSTHDLQLSGREYGSSKARTFCTHLRSCNARTPRAPAGCPRSHCHHSHSTRHLAAASPPGRNVPVGRHRRLQAGRVGRRRLPRRRQRPQHVVPVQPPRPVLQVVRPRGQQPIVPLDVGGPVFRGTGVGLWVWLLTFTRDNEKSAPALYVVGLDRTHAPPCVPE